jgi:hypothetical protein
MALIRKLSEMSLIPEESIMPAILPDIEAQIAEFAYYTAEIRGFAAGYEVEYWLVAKRDLPDQSK